MNFLLVRAVDIAFQVYSWLIIIRVVLSWIRHNPYHPAIRFIYEVTEPYLRIFRRVVPPVGMIDLSPIVAFFVLELLQVLVHRLLATLFISL
uniref:YggT family protein n=1 Tax=Ammonifex degensii TaxID=42838 RepID=A0A7C2I0G3_9THEO